MKKAKRRYSQWSWILAIVLLVTAIGVVWWSHNQTPTSGVGVQPVGSAKDLTEPQGSSKQSPARQPIGSAKDLAEPQSSSKQSPARQPVGSAKDLTEPQSSSKQSPARQPVGSAKGRTEPQSSSKQSLARQSATVPQSSGFEPPVGGVVDSENIELPRWDSSEKPIYNSLGRYRFVYMPNKRSARWVAYKLTRGDIMGSAGRSVSFTSDPRLVERGWQSATNGDYKGSGYDKGHLLPSADRSRSVAENRETFRFSNIAPQSPQLNRGPWRLLEQELRRRTADYDTLYIVVGSVPDTRALYPSNATVGNKVRYSYYTTDRKSGSEVGRSVEVPRLFYKVVALRKGADFVPQAYVMPNVSDGLSSDFRHYSVSVDSVERLTGIDCNQQI